MKFVCAVYDKGAECFGNPFVVPATGMAVRQFSDEVNREAADNPLYNHPLDFSLHQLGRYHEHNGELESDRVKLVDAVAVRAKVTGSTK